MGNQNSLPPLVFGEIKDQDIPQIFGINFHRLVGKVSPPAEVIAKMVDKQKREISDENFRGELLKFYQEALPTLTDREIFFMIYNFIESTVMMEVMDEIGDKCPCEDPEPGCPNHEDGEDPPSM